MPPGLWDHRRRLSTLRYMKQFLPIIFWIATASLTQASIIQTISLDLSILHAGSTLSGNFTLPGTPTVGDTATAVLFFSDPSDYSVSSLTTTITIGSGTIGDAVAFSPLAFANPTGNPFLKNINLVVAGAAQCTSYPCTANGRFEDGSPAAFTSRYSITPASVPEPGFGLITPIMLAGMGIALRVIRRVG